MTLRLVFLGKPGAGKGTQAAFVAQHFGIPAISTGEIVREQKRLGTELGRTFQSYADEGRLVPDDLILDMVDQRLNQPDCAQGYILDGFPRTLPQVEAFTARLEERNAELSAAIALEVTDNVVVERLSGRRFSPSTGKVYHIKFNPPRVEGRCDDTGEPLIQRADDDEQVIRKRLEVYREQTEPLLAYYADLGALRRIQGEQPVEAIQRDLIAMLEDLGAKK